VKRQFTEDEVRGLFGNSNRIVGVQFISSECPPDEWWNQFSAIVTFTSHSAARKALSYFTLWDEISLKWMTTDGNVTSNVKSKSQSFAYSLFTRDPVDSMYAIPVDSSCGDMMTSDSDDSPNSQDTSCSWNCTGADEDSIDLEESEHLLGTQLLENMSRE
jgi:hypothetical protein